MIVEKDSKKGGLMIRFVRWAGLLTIISCPGLACAQTSSAPSAIDQVKTAASEYIASLSCEKPSDVTSPVGGGIISIIHLHDAVDATMTPDTWAVIFTAGMMGTHPTVSCTGGNGNPPTEIAIVENDGGVIGGYFVDPAQSSPVVQFDEPIAVVENVVSNTPDSLTFSGVNYGPNDPQSAPSQPATVTMTVDKSGNWTVVKPPS